MENYDNIIKMENYDNIIKMENYDNIIKMENYDEIIDKRLNEKDRMLISCWRCNNKGMQFLFIQ